MDRSERQKALARWEALKSERSSWLAHWKEIAQFLLPRAGEWMLGDSHKGGKRHNDILDNTGSRALRTLGSGLMAGMTSPARPWFRLTTSDPELDEAAAVKQWLQDTTEVMGMVFRRSNTYRALHANYEELGAFGTCVTMREDDFETVINQRPLTAGEYALACDHRGRVDTIYREFQATVAQIVSEFGRENCSRAVINLWDRGVYDHRFPIVHLVEPRQQRDPRKRDNKNMPWRSVYFEQGGDGDKVLRESGFKTFPGIAARWITYGSDVYGASPGMEALGDVKQLQHQQRRKGQAIDYLTRPPLQAPTQLKNAAQNMLPGGITYVDTANPNGGIRTAWEVRLDLSHLLADIQDVRERVNSSFYADLFLMLYTQDKNGLTATEVAERHEEKLLMIGPVLERLHNEMLSPLIESTFERMIEAGIVPPAPPELEGRELNVEFVSVLAQAQSSVATNSIDRYVASLGMVAQAKPEVLDKFNADRWADVYADMLGIDAELVVSGEQVALIRQQRAQQQQAMQVAAQAEQMANAAAKLGSINTSEQNALTDATAAFTGYA